MRNRVGDRTAFGNQDDREKEKDRKEKQDAETRLVQHERITRKKSSALFRLVRFLLSFLFPLLEREDRAAIFSFFWSFFLCGETALLGDLTMGTHDRSFAPLGRGALRLFRGWRRLSVQ